MRHVIVVEHDHVTVGIKNFDPGYCVISASPGGSLLLIDTSLKIPQLVNIRGVLDAIRVPEVTNEI
jgi:hypothetical protein